MATTKSDPYADEKQAALLEAAVSLAKTPGVDASEISYRVHLLKETLNNIVFAD